MAEKAATKSVEPIHRGYHGCSSLKEYELMRKLGEGTFGEVYQGNKKESGEVVALKKILMHNEKDGFPITALREIKLLKTLNHINVIKLEEMAVERTKELKKRATLYMVTPYMEHDLSGMLDNPEINVTEPMRKCYMLQLFRGLNYLHQSYILHRDMKAANLLISNGGILKIADFGLARHYDGPLPQRHRGGGEATRDYTSLVVTRWYRPPELLLQLRRYTTAIDMWGAGCVFGEMYKRKPILAGQSDLNQAQIIFDLVGSPTTQSMPGWDSLPGADAVKNMDKSFGRIDEVFNTLDHQALSLLKLLLKLDWRTRINAMDALEHPYFTTPPLPARPEDIPEFKDSHELDRRNHRPNKALPPAPQGGTVGGGGVNGEWHGESHGGPSYHDRWPQDRGGGHRDRDYHNSRASGGTHGRDHGNGSRGMDRDRPGSRIPAGANDHRGDNRRPAWQNDSRNNGESNGSRGPTSLPPPPGEGSRHPLPMNPHRAKKDTYVPSYSDAPNREERRSRTPERRRDRYDDRRGDRYRGERRPRDEFRDRDVPRDDGYRDRREGGRRDRTRSPDRDRDRSRDRAVDSYRER